MFSIAFFLFILLNMFLCRCVFVLCFFFKQKTAYEIRISDWSSDVCSSDLNDMILQCLLNTGHAPPVICISDDEMIGCSQEDQPDEDADWRHNDGFEKPGCGRYRNYIAISDGRDGHCCEIKNVDEADLAIHTIVKAVSFKPVNEQDNAHQCEIGRAHV